MAISDNQKEEIKARIDLAELFASYGHEVKHNGSGLWCRCPFHTEKTPSCKIDPASGYYHCFGCGKSGDAIGFVMEVEGLGFKEAMEKLAEKAGVELKKFESKLAGRRKHLEDMMHKLAVDFHKMLCIKKYSEAEAAREYLAKRGISDDIAEEWLIGYVPKDIDKILGWAAKNGFTETDLIDGGILKARSSVDAKPYSYFAGRLLFTIRDKYGKVVAFSGRLLEDGKKGVGKYVNSPETLLFKKARTFFGFDKARAAIVKARNREALVCEGQIDCIRLHASGLSNAVAPLGTAFTEEHARMLHRVADSALLVFDDDAAGHKATIRAAELLLAEDMPVRVALLPDGHDPDSYIRTKGIESFRKLIEDKAESVVKFQIRAERLKESDATSPNAVVRIAKAVAATLSKCKSKVMQEALAKEAAELLGVQKDAIEEELSRAKETPAKESLDAEEMSKTKDEALVAEEAQSGPTLAEGALIGYLMMHESERGNKEVEESLKTLFPKPIFRSGLSTRIIEAFISKDEGDLIREVVENVPISDYHHFLSYMAEVDSMGEFPLKDRDKLRYFARQIWHDYLCSLFHRSNGQQKEQICRKILQLHRLSPNGLVDFIKTFPFEDFKDEIKTQDVVPA